MFPEIIKGQPSTHPHIYKIKQILWQSTVTNVLAAQTHKKFIYINFVWFC